MKGDLIKGIEVTFQPSSLDSVTEYSLDHACASLSTQPRPAKLMGQDPSYEKWKRRFAFGPASEEMQHSEEATLTR